MRTPCTTVGPPPTSHRGTAPIPKHRRTRRIRSRTPPSPLACCALNAMLLLVPWLRWWRLRQQLAARRPVVQGQKGRHGGQRVSVGQAERQGRPRHRQRRQGRPRHHPCRRGRLCCGTACTSRNRSWPGSTSCQAAGNIGCTPSCQPAKRCRHNRTRTSGRGRTC